MIFILLDHSANVNQIFFIFNITCLKKLTTTAHSVVGHTITFCFKSSYFDIRIDTINIHCIYHTFSIYVFYCVVPFYCSCKVDKYLSERDLVLSLLS